jgi:hypothetical protein
MRIYAGGREREIPTDSEGNADAVEVRRAANIPDDRAMILQRPSGENFVVPKRGRVHVDPWDRFMETSRAERG